MSTGRLHHIDALRGSVMLLLVPYHGMNYLQNSGDHVFGIDGASFWLHLWRMGLFFAVSGLLAAMTLERWGEARHLRSRVKRLGVPLLLGMLLLLPLTKLLMIGLVSLEAGPVDADRELTVANVLSPKPYHLWFLGYLLLFSVAAVGLVRLVRRREGMGARLDAAFRRLAGGPFLVPALALASALALLAGGHWKAPGSVASSLIPHAAPAAYYATFFAFGWMLFRSLDLIGRVEGRPWRKLSAGSLFAILTYQLFDNRSHIDVGPWEQYAVLLAGALATWWTLFGVWGLFARFLSGERPSLRYLADAAYWVYLIHVPFLVALEVELSRTALPPFVRLLLAVGGAIGMALASYELLVRHTAVGRFLHGPRERRPRRAKREAFPITGEHRVAVAADPSG